MVKSKWLKLVQAARLLITETPGSNDEHASSSQNSEPLQIFNATIQPNQIEGVTVQQNVPNKKRKQKSKVTSAISKNIFLNSLVDVPITFSATSTPGILQGSFSKQSTPFIETPWTIKSPNYSLHDVFVQDITALNHRPVLDSQVIQMETLVEVPISSHHENHYFKYIRDRIDIASADQNLSNHESINRAKKTIDSMEQEAASGEMLNSLVNIPVTFSAFVTSEITQKNTPVHKSSFIQTPLSAKLPTYFLHDVSIQNETVDSTKKSKRKRTELVVVSTCHNAASENVVVNPISLLNDIASVNKTGMLIDRPCLSGPTLGHMPLSIGSSSSAVDPMSLFNELATGVARATRRSKKSVSLHIPVRLVAPTQPFILPPVPPCKYCFAKRFYRESPGFCCSSGQITLVTHDAPAALWDLFTGSSPLSQEFKTYARTYNNNFAFTSLGMTCDLDFCKRVNGIYTVKAQGQVYHYMNTLLPGENAPQFMQLYFYDTEHEMDNRLKISDRLNVILIAQILKILEKNPYCVFFRSLADLPTLEECQIVIKNTPSKDQRVYNAPTSSQVAAIWVDGVSNAARDIIIFSRPGRAIRIWYYYGCYDSLQYPLLFPHGEPGWHENIHKSTTGRAPVAYHDDLPPIINADNVDEFLENEERVTQGRKNSRNFVSCREYYCYRIQIRIINRTLVIHSGRLFQQYAVDMYIKLESTRLDYLKYQQRKIRADLYSGIVDSIAIGERRGFKIGSRIILPASFIGGPRDLRRRYLDAMTLVRRYGKPDFFITMTCNPNWPEIKNELLPGEEAHNRPDLVARVFRAKVEELKNDICKKQIFGPVAAYVYVIEFQKRGLPHLHMLLILKGGHKIRSPDQFDTYVCAELPDEHKNPHLYKAVLKHMMHGPCGVLDPKNVCMRKGKCKNHYPKDFCSRTSQTEDSYPLYKRQDDGRKVTVRKHDLNNQWVIPYNPYLLAKFDCHLNVEICSTVKAVKYLYKYIYKGHDRIAFQVARPEEPETVDEITNFRDGRWISAPEAMWRIYGFTMNEIYPSVFTLQLHLENHHSIAYADAADLQTLIDSPLSNKTTLTEYFAINKVSDNARKILYSEFPEFYVWIRSTKTWQLRKKSLAIGRIVSVSPTEGERFYLKVLLSHKRGATSFDDLKIYEGTLCNSFRESAILHGLVEQDDCFRHTLAEACSYQLPISLRRLFSTLLVYCNPVNARALWEEFAGSLSEDYVRFNRGNQAVAHKKALKDISYQLESMGKDINDYMLLERPIVFDESERQAREIDDEFGLKISKTDIENVNKLNLDQKVAFDQILNCIYSSAHGAFFIDGPGGTGKSFLYSVLLATIRSQGHIALATASSGVAASMLSGGRTAHSRFKIPLTVDEFMSCSVKKQSGLAKLLRLSKLIIWDEAPMMRRQSIEAFERMMRDICECDLPFGGKVVVFGGDFRQVLPVIPKATVFETIESSLVRSFLWSTFVKIRLSLNMRAQLDQSFSKYLLAIGEGTFPTIEEDLITIPPSLTLPYNGNESLDELIALTFPKLHNYAESIEESINRAILSTKNEFVDEINNKIISRFPGEFHEYKSFDSAIESSHQGLAEDFFNSMTPSGFPAHILKLKKNSPIMLLRNIDPSKGLCNGTRLICKTFSRNTIGATIATGAYRGKHVFLPRIPLTPPSNEITVFPFTRTQFPIRLCFCMTINKAQGQTLDFVGIYLPQPVFSHGQLYVALSRARNASSVAILVVPPDQTLLKSITTRNVVYKEILALASAN